uniref:peptidoglycan-associated lipoprotein Pal n=1 Tax=Parerythrobacter lutipelagi TaxID=1964208 RepID=UPI0010F4AA61|nr:peptidoglycan-associated lipoprotein Pal [Parerythrobacter lutipelagi]
MNTKLVIASLMIGTVGLGACKPKAPDVLPPEPVETTAAVPEYQQPTGPVLGTQEHFVNGVNGLNVIFFDTDRYNIDSEDAVALQTQAQYLQRNTGISVTVEGHADERGTRDYNLALGERRANSAKNYLVSLGVDASRIRTVSYGKERPVALGSNESAWAQNRRAVTVVIN